MAWPHVFATLPAGNVPAGSTPEEAKQDWNERDPAKQIA